MKTTLYILLLISIVMLFTSFIIVSIELLGIAELIFLIAFIWLFRLNVKSTL